MQILIVSATILEIQPLEYYLKENFDFKNNIYSKEHISIELLVCGIGMMQMAFHLGQKLEQSTYDLVLNIGIAGAFSRTLQIGDLVAVERQVYGDLGAEQVDGAFQDIFEMQLMDRNRHPFKKGLLVNEIPSDFTELQAVKSLSVNKVSGASNTINTVLQRYDVEIESMEGIACFYACKYNNQPFCEIRAISNHVEPRNKANWNIPLAIDRLNMYIINYIAKNIE